MTHQLPFQRINVSRWHSVSLLAFSLSVYLQELSNLLVTEDKVEEEIADVETQLEVVHKQVTAACHRVPFLRLCCMMQDARC